MFTAAATCFQQFHSSHHFRKRENAVFVKKSSAIAIDQRAVIEQVTSDPQKPKKLTRILKNKNLLHDLAVTIGPEKMSIQVLGEVTEAFCSAAESGLPDFWCAHVEPFRLVPIYFNYGGKEWCGRYGMYDSKRTLFTNIKLPLNSFILSDIYKDYDSKDNKEAFNENVNFPECKIALERILHPIIRPSRC